MTNFHSTPEDHCEDEPHVGRQSASDERLRKIKANRQKSLANLPADFHEFGSYAVYDQTKTPYLVKPLLESKSGKLYRTGGKDFDKLSALSGVMLALEKYPEEIIHPSPDNPDKMINSTLVGPALHLLGSYRVACIDLDDPEKTYARELAKAPQDAARLAIARDRQIVVNDRVLKAFCEAGALIMKSQSGKGFHIFFRYGNPGDRAKPVNGRFTFCGDLISHRKFVFITGEQIAVEWPNEVEDGEDADADDAGGPVVRMFRSTDRLPNLSHMSSVLLMELMARGDFKPFKGIIGHNENGVRVEVPPSEDYGRKLNKTDAEVLAQLARERNETQNYEFLTTGALGTWSDKGVVRPKKATHATRWAIKALDAITGDPLQIERIVMASPALRLHPREGESREDKTQRLMLDFIAEGRARNDEFFADRQSKSLALAPGAKAMQETGLVVGHSPHVGSADVVDGEEPNDIAPLREAISFESVKRDIAAFRQEALRRKDIGERTYPDELSSIITKVALLESDRQLSAGQKDTLGSLLLDSGVHGFSDKGNGVGKKVLREMIAEACAIIMKARKQEKWQGSLMKGEYGAVLANEENAAIAVENMFGRMVKYDRFSDKIFFGGSPAVPEVPGIEVEGYGMAGGTPAIPAVPPVVVDKYGHRDLVRLVQRTAVATARKEQVREAVERLAWENQFDSLQDYLEGLKWDGVSRLDSWMHYLLGAADTPYVRQVSRWWPIGVVARALRPGCQMDNMLVLMSGQGFRKTTTIRLLSGGRNLEFDGDITSKDGKQAMRGVWMVEMSEMSALSRHDSKVHKAFQTKISDKYRKAYDVDDMEYLRQFVTVGTSNPEPFLRDPTGEERRYWIIEVGRVDPTKLARNVDQLWAEAIVAYRGGERWWPETTGGSEGPDDWFAAAQIAACSKWALVEPWEPILRTWLCNVKDDGSMTPRGAWEGTLPVTKVRGVEWILENVLGREKAQMTQNDATKVAAIMRKLGYEKKSVWLGGMTAQGYKWTGATTIGHWWVVEAVERE